jgi:hypothetical protein
MAIILDGTNGVSDVDGSASTPAIRGTDANTGIFFPAADTIAFAEGGVECARFNSSGNLQTIGTISVGNATPSTSGAGITFPATVSASSDANTLDDYEEGTFDVAVAFGGASAGITYTQRNFAYVKIGNTVFISGYVVLSNKGSSTGNATITGLPFTSASGNATYSAFSLHIANTTFGGFPNMFISPSSAVLDFYECSDAGSVSAITNADFGNTSGLIISGFYRT